MLFQKCRFTMLNIVVIIAFMTLCESFQRISKLLVGSNHCRRVLTMALDEFVQEKLKGMSKSFDALTERLADPDLANNRKEMLRISRERAGMEPTILAYNNWKSLEEERLGCAEMELESGDDPEMKEMARMVSWIYSCMPVCPCVFG